MLKFWMEDKYHLILFEYFCLIGLDSNKLEYNYKLSIVCRLEMVCYIELEC